MDNKEYIFYSDTKKYSKPWLIGLIICFTLALFLLIVSVFKEDYKLLSTSLTGFGCGIIVSLLYIDVCHAYVKITKDKIESCFLFIKVVKRLSKLKSYKYAKSRYGNFQLYFVAQSTPVTITIIDDNIVAFINLLNLIIEQNNANINDNIDGF